MKHPAALFLLLSVLVAGPALAAAPEMWDGSPASVSRARVSPVAGTGGMVVAEDRVAATFGAEILRAGGNAVDAAVATVFTMAVTRPQYASLGGGGFMLICFAGKPCEALDLREVAPSAAGRDFYVRDGKARTELSQNGALASGVPGLPAGLFAALEKYGTLPRARLIARGIELATNGTPLSTRTEDALADRWPDMNAEARRVFGCGQATALAPCPVGTLIRQPDLARVLRALSDEGAPAFYSGWIARRIVEGVRAKGGALTLEDFARYRVRWRAPLAGSFEGWQVVTMPPPSAGGFVLLQMLGYTERASLEGPYDPATLHAEAHAMALAFADRARYAGDPEFTHVPVLELLDKAYLDARWKTFDPAKVNLPEAAGDVAIREIPHTTHFSVVDRHGNAVAFTLTINDSFGSGFMPPGTGIVMNDEMDDFSIEPGVPNLYGLVGGEANAVAPGKRPLSSMVPTIVRDGEGRARIVIGAAGGPRITTSVYLSLVNRLHFGMALTDAVAAPRIHQQWKPAALRVERFGFPATTLTALSARGWQLEPVVKSAIVHALERFPGGRVWGAADPRGEGVAVSCDCYHFSEGRGDAHRGEKW